MDTALVVGYLASVCSVTSFVPQVWKIFKTGNTAAISVKMYTLTVTGFALWTAFGILRVEWPIILTNAICFCLSGLILIKTISAKSASKA
jgi:MtN3 and saliva related transmembrane protein